MSSTESHRRASFSESPALRTEATFAPSANAAALTVQYPSFSSIYSPPTDLLVLARLIKESHLVAAAILFVRSCDKFSSQSV